MLLFNYLPIFFSDDLCDNPPRMNKAADNNTFIKMEYYINSVTKHEISKNTTHTNDGANYLNLQHDDSIKPSNDLNINKIIALDPLDKDIVKQCSNENFLHKNQLKISPFNRFKTHDSPYQNEHLTSTCNEMALSNFNDIVNKKPIQNKLEYNNFVQNKTESKHYKSKVSSLKGKRAESDSLKLDMEKEKLQKSNISSFRNKNEQNEDVLKQCSKSLKRYQRNLNYKMKQDELKGQSINKTKGQKKLEECLMGAFFQGNFFLVIIFILI